MGNLPKARVLPARPFLRTGVDYAGPFLAVDRRGRGKTYYKVYLAIFICLVTKAVHLELVTDLTTDAFIAALKRFSDRRGLPRELHFDNGTQFVGANRELARVQDILSSSPASKYFAKTRILFRFIPPRSPNFGGLWEAAVRSTKHHLTRIIGNSHFTYEELLTVFTRIEAILNSRPLCPLSDDPDDLEVLTSAHFLIGSTMTQVPEISLYECNETHLARWQSIQFVTQQYWRRWSGEYLSQFHKRTKWRTHAATPR